MNKNITIGLVVVVLGVGGYFFYIKSKTVDPDAFVSKVQVSSSTPKYTLADVSTHSKETDCWTVVSGKVFNVTEFIPSHPGGKAIVKACGKDGTNLFMSEDEHVEQNAQGILDNYFIGTLSN